MNGLEYILDNDGGVKEFETVDKAKQFLIDAGEAESNLENYVFEKISDYRK